MNTGKMLLAALIVFIALIITNFIIHGAIMSEVYSSLAEEGIIRPESEMSRYTWVEIITTLVYAFFFTFIFVKGYENKGILEGIRFGIYITIFYSFVTAFGQFVVYGIPYSITWAWILIGLIQNVILGIIAALIYKPKPALP
jgi:ABC-type multidrug transport system permease subunit